MLYISKNLKVTLQEELTSFNDYVSTHYENRLNRGLGFPYASIYPNFTNDASLVIMTISDPDGCHLTDTYCTLSHSLNYGYDDSNIIYEDEVL
ncbi:MAG: hypothetical protein LUH21_12050 [Clostridiales bacterium]|nr:hypothetical protein [Clostridiales bacterium]